MDGAPRLIDEARDRLRDGSARAGDRAREGGRVVNDAVRDTPLLWVAAAVAGAYALAWAIHGRRG